MTHAGREKALEPLASRATWVHRSDAVSPGRTSEVVSHAAMLADLVIWLLAARSVFGKRESVASRSELQRGEGRLVA